MQFLKQSTAATVLVGPVLDADGAAVTGAVISDFRLAKNGTVATMAGNTISHSHNGCYLITLTTADTNTLTRLSISVGNTSYNMTIFRYIVLNANQYDALLTNGVLTPLAIADAVWDEASADHTASGSFGFVLGSKISPIVAPLLQTNAQRSQPAYIETYQYDQSTLGPFRIEDSNGEQFDLATQNDWIVVVWDKDDNELGVVSYSDIEFTSSTSDAVMDQYSFAPVSTQVSTAGRHRFALRRPRGTTEQTAVNGLFNVIAAPRAPA